MSRSSRSEPTRSDLRPSWLAVPIAAATALVLLASGVGAVEPSTDLTGQVINLRGAPVDAAIVEVAGRTTTTDAQGRFLFESLPAQSATVDVRRVAYAPVSGAWDGSGDGLLTITMSPRIARALHVSGPVGASDSSWQSMLDIAESTSVNAVMLDVKTESGFVFAENELDSVAEIGANAPNQYDLATRVDQAHDAGLYAIVRIVSFQDPKAALHHPDWAAWNTATNGPYNKAGQYFLDPYDPGARAYVLELAQHACAAGVDEVQFDYMRFPAGDPDTVVYDGPNTDVGRQTTIASFLGEARAELLPMECATAVDIFGFITNKTHEGGIGQQLELLTTVTDVISPMTYPSLYSVNWYGFTDPSAHPGPVVRNANQDALDRMQDTSTVLRPWLQDFYYTAAQVEIQLVEADALGLGWMLWNVASEFTVNGILTEDRIVTSEDVPPATWTPLPDSGFYDVAPGHLFETEIAWARALQITLGCNPPYGDIFCASAPVSRGQMAAFLNRALDLEAEGGDPFDDDDGSTFEADIEAIASAGITLGCGERRFCPHELLTRAQMATFLVRALELEPLEDPGRFLDDTGSIHESNIAAAATAGITQGCAAGPQLFCPYAFVTRGQMATFLYRALVDPGPG